MQRIPSKYKKLVLVCTNQRTDGTKCCADGGGEDLRVKLKEKCKELRLPVRVSKAGCMDACSTGPTVVIMPDDVWLGGVTAADIDEIIEMLR